MKSGSRPTDTHLSIKSRTKWTAEIGGNTAILCSRLITDTNGKPRKAKYLRSSWSYWMACLGNCENRMCHCPVQDPHTACASEQGWCHCRGPLSQRRALSPCTDRCRRGSLRFPGRRDRAPGCAQFHGSSCACGQGFRRTKDSAQCHLRGEKRRASFALSSSEQQEKGKGRQSQGQIHQQFIKSSVAQTGFWTMNQANCPLRATAQQDFILPLIWGLRMRNHGTKSNLLSQKHSDNWSFHWIWSVWLAC